MDTTPQLSGLHKSYCALTLRELPMTMRHLWAWELWQAKGFNQDDLRMVVLHIKSMIKKDRRREESFRFHNLIEDTDRFLEDLAEAKSMARIPKPTPRTRILEATGRTEPVRDTVRSAESVLRGNEQLKRLLELRDAL